MPSINLKGSYKFTATEEDFLSGVLSPTFTTSPITTKLFSLNGFHLLFKKGPKNDDVLRQMELTIQSVDKKGHIDTTDNGTVNLTLNTRSGGAGAQLLGQTMATFVNGVLASTGASKVDIVGHSQGGMMPRYYMKFDGGASKIHTLVGLAPSNHGTTLNGLFTLAGYFPGANAALTACPACAEQEAGSSLMTKLNTGGDTLPGVHYTVIESQNDEVVTPYTSAFLTGPSSQVTNIDLQKQCSLDQGEHLSMPYDHIADADVLTALDPADPPAKAACTPVAPVVGG